MVYVCRREIFSDRLPVVREMLSSALAGVIRLDADTCAALVDENDREFTLRVDHDGGLFVFARDTSERGKQSAGA